MQSSPEAHDAGSGLPVWQARWLAEVVRRHEDADGMLEDGEAVRAARAAPADFETRLCVRAALLGAREGWRASLVRAVAHLRLLLAVAALLACLAGAGAAAGVLGDGSRPVNVVWALGGLLGLHLVSLVLWGAGLLLAGGARPAAAAGGLAGRIATAWVTLLDRGAAAARLPAALADLLAPVRGMRWGLGAVVHGLWALALAGAAVALLALFATRRYGFVWETTILPADVFVAAGELLGRLPAAFGLPVPDASTVAASGAAAGAADEAGRRAWAGWLLGCVLFYGLAPRLLLAAFCAWRWRAARARLRLDLARPGYAVLRPRLLPDSDRLGVSDPASAVAVATAAPHALANDGSRLALALELGADLPWPPAFAAAGGAAGNRLDSREQHQRWRARLHASAPRRLLLAVDARQTPDRGSLGLIAELAALAGETRVWALRPAGAVDRRALWQAGLAARGLVMVDEAAEAQAWLEAA